MANAAMRPAVEFSELHYVVRLYQQRGRQAMGELAPAIAESMHHAVMEVFETDGHGEWPRYSWETDGLPKPSGRRWQGNPKLLRDTGNLAGSMTPDWDEHAVEVYTNVRYAKYHVTGTRIMPKRDPFGIDAEAFEQDVVDMLEVHLTRDAAAE